MYQYTGDSILWTKSWSAIFGTMLAYLTLNRHIFVHMFGSMFNLTSNVEQNFGIVDSTLILLKYLVPLVLNAYIVS